MEKIISKPATKDYRENWERIFKPEEVEVNSKSRLKRIAIQQEGHLEEIYNIIKEGE